MLKIKQIEKEDLNLKNLIELSMKYDVYCICISNLDTIKIYGGDRIRDLRLSQIESRINHPEAFAFIYIEEENKDETIFSKDS